MKSTGKIDCVTVCPILPEYNQGLEKKNIEAADLKSNPGILIILH